MNSEKNPVSRTLGVAIMASSLLMVFKFAAGWLTHSMAIMASALDSLTDVGSSCINFFASREAVKPPDEDHEYGHGKIESLAGLFQSLFVMASGLYLVFEAIQRLLRGAHVDRMGVGVGAMAVSLTGTLFLVLYIRKNAAAQRSLILETESLHYSMDLLTGASVIGALLLVRMTGLVIWDLLISLFVSAYILWNAAKIFRRAVGELLDRSLEPELRKSIEQTILQHDSRIVGIHNFRGRRVGERIFLDFHVEILGEKDFQRAHGLAESLVNEIKKNHPGTDVTVHYDPEGAD